jgi:hypothetical protein
MKAIVLVSLTDVTTCVVAMLVLGVAAEANPFARGMFLAYGIVGLFALKAIPVLGMAFARTHLTALNWRVLWVWIVGLGIFGTVSNTLAFFVNGR